MAQYTRYDTTFAYSNAIAQRLDYTSARVAAQKQAKAGEGQKTLSDGTQILAEEDVAIDGHGTVQAVSYTQLAASSTRSSASTFRLQAERKEPFTYQEAVLAVSSSSIMTLFFPTAAFRESL